MRISFDYDGTFTRPDVKEIAQQLMEDHEVFILTAREYKENLDLYKAAFEIGFNPSQILYSKHKFQTIVDMKIEAHVDNDPEILHLIKGTSKCKTFNCNNGDWLEKFSEFVFGF